VEQVVQLVELFVTQVLGTGTALLKMPQVVEQLLAKVESGDLAVNINTALRGPVGLRRRKSETGNSAVTPGISWPVMFAAALAGGILLLITTHQFLAAWVCFALAALCGVRGWLNS
jgi:hypothetical protein